MEMKAILESVKVNVLTPAARGAVQAVLEKFTAPPQRGGRSFLSALALVGFGVAIGAASALMLAPATGKEVRTRLMQLVSKLQTKGEPAADTEEADADKGAKPEGGGAGNSNGKRQRAPVATAPTS